MPAALTSIHGRRLGLGAKNQLVSNEIQISAPCVDASYTIGAKVANVRTIAIQLKDSMGQDINYREMVELYAFADANGDAFAVTGGSTGVAIGTDGALLTTVAKKAFTLVSEADGDIDLTYTDTASEVVYLAIRLPGGRLVFSTNLA